MSTYTTLNGSITFPSIELKMAAIEPLIKGGWMRRDDDGVLVWVNELGQAVDEGQPVDSTELVVSEHCHRNILNVINLVVSTASTYRLYYYSTDGQVVAGLIAPEGRVRAVGNELLNYMPSVDQEEKDLLSMDVDQYEKKYDADWFQDVDSLLNSVVEKLHDYQFQA